MQQRAFADFRHAIQIDHHEATQFQVIEEEVKLVVLSPNFKRHLAADEREAGAQLHKELAQMGDCDLDISASERRDESVGVRPVPVVFLESGSARQPCGGGADGAEVAAPRELHSGCGARPEFS